MDPQTLTTVLGGLAALGATVPPLLAARGRATRRDRRELATLRRVVEVQARAIHLLRMHQVTDDPDPILAELDRQLDALDLQLYADD